MAEGRARNAVGVLAGLLALLVFTHDFYTGYLAFPRWRRCSHRACSGAVGETVVATLRDTWSGIGDFWSRCPPAPSLGAAIFLALVLEGLSRESGFPEDQLNNALFVVRPTDWHSVTDVLSGLIAYDTARSLWLTLLAAGRARVALDRCPAERTAAGGLAGRGVDRRVCHSARLARLLAVESRSLLAPRRRRRFVIRSELSLLYELAIAIVSRGARWRACLAVVARGVIAATMAVLLIADWNRTAFDFGRPVATSSAGCLRRLRSTRHASPFSSRARRARTCRDPGTWRRSTPATRCSLRCSAACRRSTATPPGRPATGTSRILTRTRYLQNVRELIGLRGMSNVCALDIDARTMVPYVPGDLQFSA